mgnify:CR=1 FL=1
MRLLNAVLRFAVAAVFSAGIVGAQVLLENALSAAGGSAAGVAGKPASEAVGKIFRKLEEQQQQSPALAEATALEQAAGQAEPAAAPLPGGPAARSGPGRGRADVSAPSSEPAAPSPYWRTPPTPAPQPARPQLSEEDLASIEVGASREDLVARLGSPAARIIIPDQGGLREVYFFSGRGRHLGTVELTRGEVNAINLSTYDR